MPIADNNSVRDPLDAIEKPGGAPTIVDDRTREFLVKLAALCAEYSLSISGCGCCGSPSISSVDGSVALDDLDAGPTGCSVGGRWYRADADGIPVQPLEWLHAFHVDVDGVVTVNTR